MAFITLGFILFGDSLIAIPIPVDNEHPYPLDPNAKPEVYIKKGSSHKKGRKSAASRKKKKRWY